MSTQRESWLALTVEDALEPGMPICDPHHHFWDRDGDRYLLNQLTQDVGGGHNIAQTVFIECRSMYRAQGPEEMRSVGEVEFVQGIAAQSASGQYGSTAVASGIVGNANLMLGAAVEPVLEAHLAASNNRFRGIRFSCAWDASPEVTAGRSNSPGMMQDPQFRAGFDRLQRMGLSYDAPGLPHPVGRTGRFGGGFPQCGHHSEPYWPPPGNRSLRWETRRGVCRLESRDRRRGSPRKRGGQAGGLRKRHKRLRLAPTGHPSKRHARWPRQSNPG